VDLPSVLPGERYFDLTTPLLARELRARATPATRLLDMGTGPFAILGLSTWRASGCSVVCSDVDEAIVARARETVALNRAPLAVVRSRLFDAVDGPFDLVAFNAPYVPTADVRASERFPVQSDGGPTGTEVVGGFLDAFAAAGGDAVALLGIGGLHVDVSRVKGLVAARPLRLEKSVSSPWGAHVFVLRRK
jgi:release factor glutamine methyltransferase